MTGKKRLLLLLILLILVLFRFTTNRKNRNNPVNESEFKSSLGISNSRTDQPAHPLTFFDQNTFYPGIEQAKKKRKPFTYHVSGGIIPHHLFPGFIIADFFNRLSGQKPETVILIGPNHYELGNFKALTSLYGWQTPFGVVEPNESIIRKLLKDNLVKVDENVLPKDHSVAGIMPFIKYYLPNAQVIPILLSGRMNEAEVRILAENLKNYVGNEIVIIAAVDFSHYLSNQQAQEKDRLTLKVMKNFDYRQLFALNNDHLDSPTPIATFLMIMQSLGTIKMDLLYHTNSGELQKDNYIETTSYFSMAFY